MVAVSFSFNPINCFPKGNCGDKAVHSIQPITALPNATLINKYPLSVFTRLPITAIAATIAELIFSFKTFCATICDYCSRLFACSICSIAEVFHAYRLQYFLFCWCYSLLFLLTPAGAYLFYHPIWKDNADVLFVLKS